VQEYAGAIRRLAQERRLQTVDLTKYLGGGSLTSDGLQFTPQGHAEIARAFARQTGAGDAVDRAGLTDGNGVWFNAAFEQLRQEILRKNQFWFDSWRPQNWAFLGGDRVEQPSSRDHRDPKIRWFPEEMKRFASLVSDAENKIQMAAHAAR
jgi:hypothetical protein